MERIELERKLSIYELHKGIFHIFKGICLLIVGDEFVDIWLTDRIGHCKIRICIDGKLIHKEKLEQVTRRIRVPRWKFDDCL